MSTQTLDPNVYTKKGTLRKRKPKKDRNYFTQETEDAIVEFVACEDQTLRNKIYKDKIHYAFFKLTENLIHTYKYYYTDNHTVEELQHNAIIFLLERLEKFKPGKGKAYSYFGTIAKRYFIFNNANNYKKLQTHQDIAEVTLDDEEVIQKELIVEAYEDNSLGSFFEVYITYNEQYLEKLYPKLKEQQVAEAVLQLFKTRENLDIFNKKAFYIFIREMVDADTTLITKVIKKMKLLYAQLYNDYARDGVVKKL
jgi:hypothetical protein